MNYYLLNEWHWWPQRDHHRSGNSIRIHSLARARKTLQPNGMLERSPGTLKPVIMARDEDCCAFLRLMPPSPSRHAQSAVHTPGEFEVCTHVQVSTVATGKQIQPSYEGPYEVLEHESTRSVLMSMSGSRWFP